MTKRATDVLFKLVLDLGEKETFLIFYMVRDQRVIAKDRKGWDFGNPILRQRGDNALGSNHECATFRVRTDGIKGKTLRCCFPADALRICRPTKLKDEILGNDDQPVAVCAARIGRGRKVRLRLSLGKPPGLSAIFCEREIGAVIVSTFVVASGDHTVERIAKGDREYPRRFDPMNDGALEYFAGFSIISLVEVRVSFAAGREPDVGVKRGWG